MLNSLVADDRLFITTLGSLGRPTQTVFDLAEDLRTRDIMLHVFHLSCRVVGTKSHMGAIEFTVTSTLAQMDLAIKQERVNDSESKHRHTGNERGLTTKVRIATFPCRTRSAQTPEAESPNSTNARISTESGSFGDAHLN